MERKFWIRALVLGLLAVLILVGGGTFYLARMQWSMWEQSVESMMEVTSQGAKSFEVYVDQGLAMLAGRANNFAQFSSQDTAAIGAKLELYEEGDPVFTVIDITHEVIYFNSTESVPLPREKAKLYQTLPSQGFLEPYFSEYYVDSPMLGYYERFTFADGAQGMVRKSVRQSEASKRFSLSFYDGAGSSYIVNAEGNIILRPGSGKEEDVTNVFDVITSAKDAEALRAGMAARDRGVMQMEMGEVDYIFAYVPIRNVSGWYLVSVVPDDVVMENADQVLMTSQTLVAVIAAAMLILLAFIFVTVQHRRQVRVKETEVLYREHLFNLLANNTNDVFVMLSSDGKTVHYVSPNVERVTGVSADEVSKSLDALQRVIHGDDTDFDLANILPIPLGQSVTFQGHCVHRTTRERRWYMETVYHTTLESLERYIIVLADRTEDRQKEAVLTDALQIAEVANRSKSAFLSNMSHDIRTPMNAIVGLATLLARDAEDPEKVREHTNKITASSQHLLGLINDVLDMSKIESGKTTLNVGQFNLAEFIDELTAIIRPQTKAKGQSFDVTVRGVCNEDLLGDKLRISQVMINILSNAVKYTPENGRVALTVQQLGQATQSVARIRFTVADNGIGMSEEYQRQIFQPFTREAREVVDQTQGTGLGMAITKSLVDLMGGAISVKSELGKGSTFVIELDLRVQEQEDETNFWSDHGISSALVVDDEMDVCTGILSAMAGTTVTMQFALDGPTAVSMTELAYKNDQGFDLVLLDWKMPGMDGLETARQIRARIPAHIPIMILTAYDWEEIRDEGMAAGIDGFLSKPFFLSNFKEVVRSIRAAEQMEPAAEKTAGTLAGRHFLCAEDNELNMEILKELLDMEGATCESVANGREAVERFAAAPAGTFDAVLMDVQMPVMNGYDATRGIRALDHPHAQTVPIVAMTANAFADDVRDALNAGMNAHVVKPLDMAKLIEVLTRLWSTRSEFSK